MFDEWEENVNCYNNSVVVLMFKNGLLWFVELYVR